MSNFCYEIHRRPPTSSLLLAAQSYHPIITEGKQFTVWWDEDGPGFFTTRHYWFEGDTTLSGKVYQKLYYDNIHNPFDTGTICSLLREDTASHKVYRLIYAFSGDSLHSQTEHLLYDFNLQIGDSLLVLGSYYQWQWKKITLIDTVGLLNGEIVKRWHTTEGDYFNNTVLFSEEVPFGQVQPDIVLGLAGQLQCAFTANAVKLFGNAWCNDKYISIDETDLTIGVTIYPNPASSIVVLNSPSSGGFELYDVLGKLVLKSSISIDEQKTLSVAKLPAGMYVWVFRTEKGLEKGKLLIEK